MDIRSVKALWSILLGVVMALSSFAVPGQDSAQVRACSCCSCAQLDCCGTPVFPNSPVSVPSKSTEQRAQAPTLVVAVLLTTPPASDVPPLSLRSFSVPQGPTVPIYDRNCSYLI